MQFNTPLAANWSPLPLITAVPGQYALQEGGGEGAVSSHNYTTSQIKSAHVEAVKSRLSFPSCTLYYCRVINSLTISWRFMTSKITPVQGAFPFLCCHFMFLLTHGVKSGASHATICVSIGFPMRPMLINFQIKSLLNNLTRIVDLWWITSCCPVARRQMNFKTLMFVCAAFCG